MGRVCVFFHRSMLRRLRLFTKQQFNQQRRNQIVGTLSNVHTVCRFQDRKQRSGVRIQI